MELTTIRTIMSLALQLPPNQCVHHLRPHPHRSIATVLSCRPRFFPLNYRTHKFRHFKRPQRPPPVSQTAEVPQQVEELVKDVRDRSNCGSTIRPYRRNIWIIMKQPRTSPQEENNSSSNSNNKIALEHVPAEWRDNRLTDVRILQMKR